MTIETPLLLLPGLMNDERVWTPVCDALPEGRVVVVSATHGADSIEALASLAIRSMPPGRFGVAGFSLGGYVALELCRQVPERIAGVALLDTGARADTEEATQNRLRLLAALASGSTDVSRIAADLVPRLLHASQADDGGLIALIVDMARNVGRDGYVRQQTAAMHRADRRDVVASLRCPALVVCGRDDQVTPPFLSEEIASLLAGPVERVLIDRCGHMSTLEHPSAVAGAVVRWAARVDAALAPTASR